MCWSLPVAAAFATVESLLLLSMVLRTRWRKTVDLFPAGTVALVQRNDNFILPMLLTINIVEWSEAAIWASGPVPRDSLGHQRCNPVNHVFTAICGWVVMLQPTFVMVFARFTGPEEQRPWFTIPLCLAVLTTLGWFLRLILGEAGVGLVESRQKMALSWSQTCSFHNVGHKHLEWRFALADSVVLPTMFSYHLFFNVALMFHNFPIGLAAAWGSLVTLIVQFAVLDGDGEAWSVWCWSGIFFICYYWLVNLVVVVPGSHPWQAWAAANTAAGVAASRGLEGPEQPEMDASGGDEVTSLSGPEGPQQVPLDVVHVGHVGQ
jgi:hypothetical protein